MYASIVYYCIREGADWLVFEFSFDTGTCFVPGGGQGLRVTFFFFLIISTSSCYMKTSRICVPSKKNAYLLTSGQNEYTRSKYIKDSEHVRTPRSYFQTVVRPSTDFSLPYSPHRPSRAQSMTPPLVLLPSCFRSRCLITPPGLPFFFRLIRGAVSGLECMHEHGFTHGDVKLENLLMLANLDKCKVADFGSAGSEYV